MKADCASSQGDFIAQNLNLPASRAYLTDPEIESEELARLEALTSEVSPAPLWDASGFEQPHLSELTTPFGAFRRLGEDQQSRHTGWDQNLPTGTPVRAMAAGEARFAGPLDIRGNYVLIDHGLGIYSGYAHFSEYHVEAGQRCQRWADHRLERQHGPQQRAASALGNRHSGTLGGRLDLPRSLAAGAKWLEGKPERAAIILIAEQFNV